MKRLFTILAIWIIGIITSKILFILTIQSDISGGVDRSITYLGVFPIAIALLWSLWQIVVFIKQKSQNNQSPQPTEDIYKRLFITLMVWLTSIVAGVGILMLNIPVSVVLISILAITTVMWTGLSWKYPLLKRMVFHSTTLPYKMALLLELMDDNELETFKHELKHEILSSETGYGNFDRLVIEKRKRK